MGALRSSSQETWSFRRGCIDDKFYHHVTVKRHMLIGREHGLANPNDDAGKEVGNSYSETPRT